MCNFKKTIEYLSDKLLKLGYKVGKIHGDMTVEDRFAKIKMFKKGECYILEADTEDYVTLHKNKFPDLKALDSQKSSIAVSKDSTEAYLALNKKAFVGWTTTSHSGIAVPLYSIGSGSGNFNGRIDNTDIPKLILKSMRIPF